MLQLTVGGIDEVIAGDSVGRNEGFDDGTKVGLLEGDSLAVKVGFGVPLGVGLKEGDTDGTTEGAADGTYEGILLGNAEGIVEGVVVGSLDGAADGNEVEGEELGKAVTSKSRQKSLTSQQTLQHLHTTSAGLSPSISARQSDDKASIKVNEEQRAFGTSPVSWFFSRDMRCKVARKPSWSGIPPSRELL